MDDRFAALEKPRFGAFHGTDLELILRSRGIDSVIISGIHTTVCVDTTAREADMRDFRVFFLSDGTSTATRMACRGTCCSRRPAPCSARPSPKW